MKEKTIYLLIILIVLSLAGYLYRGEIARMFGGSNGPSTAVSETEYKNTQYGFSFDLPESWQGYSSVEIEWRGDSIDTDGNLQLGTVTGPEILIRHPQWSEASPRQDIPVMIFTIQQWNDMQADKFHIGAAPINPSELGRNDTYVFGLPARYNFAYLPGYEEVDQLIQARSLQAF